MLWYLIALDNENAMDDLFQSRCKVQGRKLFGDHILCQKLAAVADHRVFFIAVVVVVVVVVVGVFATVVTVAVSVVSAV